MRFFIMIGCMLIAKAIDPTIFEEGLVIMVIALIGAIADYYELFHKPKK